jgi:hypothetical protein
VADRTLSLAIFLSALVRVGINDLLVPIPRHLQDVATMDL